MFIALGLNRIQVGNDPEKARFEPGLGIPIPFPQGDTSKFDMELHCKAVRSLRVPLDFEAVAGLVICELAE